MCRSAARIREGLSWGSRWYKPKEGTLSGAFFDPGRFRSAGTGAQIWGKEKSSERNSAPGLCLWQERSVSIPNCMVSQKREGACVGKPQVPATHGAKRKTPPQRAAFGYAECLGAKRKRHLSVPFSFGAEDGTRTHTPKYWLLRPERLPFRHFRLFHFGPAHSQNSRPTSTRIIPFLALPCQFPGLSPPFGGCLSTGVVLG